MEKDLPCPIYAAIWHEIGQWRAALCCAAYCRRGDIAAVTAPTLGPKPLSDHILFTTDRMQSTFCSLHIKNSGLSGRYATAQLGLVL